VRFEPAADADDRGSARADADVTFERALPLGEVQLVRAEPGQPLADAEAELERSADVVYAEPNFIRQLRAVPNDPLFAHLYGLQNTGQSLAEAFGTPDMDIFGTPDADIDAPEAWELTTGSSQVVAAVVDSGVDIGHPDLSSSIWTNPGESGGGLESNGTDDDANGLVDDWRGWDWVTDDNLPGDENSHGTHVSGTIAASGDDATGVTGVSQSSRVMALRVLDAEGSGTVADLISAYRYASEQGAQIVNASVGGSSFSRAELDAIEAAPNTLFVVAAGNGGEDGVGDNEDAIPDYPCAYEAANVACVAASDENDDLAGFSNFSSTSVDLAAPGVRILSTVPGGGYSYFSGTSMAAPHTAGVAALIWSLQPRASVAEVKAALLGGAEARGAFAGKTATGGRLNAERSLRLAAASAGVSLPEEPAPEPSDSIVLDRSAPALSLALSSRRRLRVVLSRGLALRARCSERCGVRMRMVVNGRSARQSGLSRSSSQTVVVGRTVVAMAPGAKRVVIRFGREARTRLRHLRSVRLSVRAVATDRAGNARPRSLKILLRR